MKSLIGISCLGLLYCLEGFFPLFEGRSPRSRARHSAKNISFGIINSALTHVIFAGLIYKTLDWAASHQFGLLRSMPLSSVYAVPLGFLLLDLWMYVWHTANHRIDFFWRFHRMHHSDLEMDASSAVRFHAGEIMLSHCARLIILPLLGVDFSTLLVYETALQPVILFHHSNIALPEKWDRALRFLIVTPNMHRVHHSQVLAETNSNYSSIFSFWDRIFRSFKKRDDVNNIQLGLSQFSASYWQSLAGMFQTPWVGKV